MTTETPSALVPSAPYEPCQECGAPLDQQQRYCVSCAARRANGTNPSSRYFAAASRRARRPSAPPPAKGGDRAAAVVFFALLPLAVGLGVVVGRSSGEDDSALLDALRERNAAVASTAASAAETSASKARAGKKAVKGADETGAKVVGKTKYGTVHQITNFVPPPEKIKEDTRIVNEIATKGGADYIEDQKDLPDVIVVGGDPDTAPPLPTGAEP